MEPVLDPTDPELRRVKTTPVSIGSELSGGNNQGSAYHSREMLLEPRSHVQCMRNFEPVARRW